MPPPKGTPNPLEGPGDYTTTQTIHSDTYPAISPSNFNYNGLAVFIIGASKGLGRSMALSYASAGASYIAAGARSSLSHLAPLIASAATSAGHPAPQFLPLTVDVTSRTSVDAAAHAITSQFGRIDIVVHSAGAILNRSLLADSDPDTWWDEMRLHVLAPMLVARAFVPLLLASPRAYLAFVSSVGAWCASPTLSAYQTGKAALAKLCMHIDAEYGGKGLTTFCIHPGNVPTDIVGGKEGVSGGVLERVFVDSEEIAAHTLVWVTSEKRAWVGGRYVNVTWDMDELEARSGEIVERDLLKVTLAV
ncbi:putative 2-(R)-hydroxypropyl-CoM dehydrogenase [Pseudovirgaria hyperparasitica]|uniref:2-(R)-hydroxypropyl-CoM dehydrogenase n=1 Tax=Pseudovirgaria hyperparasitica TaxID=470096 RepID=A0A6A6W089_9PEZI|nr:putative 2-(R)-hydroxypropyl-CoM dehydrogenase [Pseudovirgaria hyperparasitica]KAF2755925.1 putative 2-(R)-hydroxypropyl-CoM dehydrogenase [Pseudovirgaria hyperparasitica]